MAINIGANETIASLSTTINQSINETINTTVPKILGYSVPITTDPVIDIFIIALLVSLFVTVINKYMGDQKKIKALKIEMKELRTKQKEIMKTKDPNKMKAIQQEIMKKSMENMKHTMNPKIMLITMAPLFIVLGVIRKSYSPLGDILNLGFTQFGWLGTYILFSIAWSMIMKKVLDVA